MRHSLLSIVVLCTLACGGGGADPLVPSLDEVTGTWMVLAEHEGTPAILYYCESDAPSLFIDATTIEENFGQEAQGSTILGTAATAGGLEVKSRSEYDIESVDYLRWEADRTRLVWSDSPGGEGWTMVRKDDPSVPVFTECCSSTEDEPLGPTYAWVKSGSECPPQPE